MIVMKLGNGKISPGIFVRNTHSNPNPLFNPALVIHQPSNLIPFKNQERNTFEPSNLPMSK